MSANLFPRTDAEIVAGMSFGNASASTRRRNPHLFKPEPEAEAPAVSKADAPQVRCQCATQTTTDESRLNKTERAWLAELRRRNCLAIGIQGVTLKLADDTRYTPDFTSLDDQGRLYAWEVKGFMRDDARVKLRVAARSYLWIRFVLVRREKGQWITEEIAP